jgi:hypothetical protein
MNIKDLVKNKTVIFEFYFDGCLYYSVVGEDFTFPVPITDIGNTTFKREDTANMFMRYIHKQLEFLKGCDDEIQK